FQRFSGGTRRIMVVDREGRTPPRVVAEGAGARPSWSRDGRSIWTATNVRLERHDAASGAVVETAPLPPGTIALRALARPGPQVLVAMPPVQGSGQAGLAVFDAERTPHWLFHGDIDEALAASPDGRRAFAARMLATGSTELLDLPVDGSPTRSL